ncbi:hypothetical protein [Terrabacter sp. RAF57]|uniref:hypothetical protein n=1 Tax=Terrabacter sp. RAF57 TaxID=3233063 RepID=UPI003F98AD02
MKRNYGFYFEEAGLSRPQGATSADEEHFKGSKSDMSLARELGQNSLDAVDKDGSGVVRMVFELAEMPTADIPDLETLRLHLRAADEATRSIDAGNTRLQAAADAVDQDSIMVLRVGDYGTLGLTGGEGADDYAEPLVALTRGAGISAGKGGGGGSFGVGSSVGTMSSDLRTVLWTSLPRGSSEVVFAGYSQLATHKINGAYRQADGFFTDKNDTTDFHYLRSPGPIGPFGVRTEQGTDVYILGYGKAGDDPELTAIRDAFVSDFMVAIHRGRLIVEGHTPTRKWVLDKSSLSDCVPLVAEAAPFYRAMMDPDPYVEVVGGLGEMRLFVEVDDALPHKLNTITMRKQLMHVTTYRHNSISAKYAAIMECSNDEGNDKLRVLEPPLHNEWDPGRAAGGTATVKAVKDFIGRGLKAKVGQQIGAEIKIKGLSRFLPSSLGVEGDPANGNGGRPSNSEGTDRESAGIQGKPADELGVTNTRGGSVAVRVQKPASSGGDDPIAKGKDTGGDGRRKKGDIGLPGHGAAGEGRAKIAAGSVRMRSWSDKATGDIIAALRADDDVEGDLWLRALGSGGQVEEDYVLPIAAVTDESNGSPVDLEVDGNAIRDVAIRAGSPVRLRIKLNENRRFRLGVM